MDMTGSASFNNCLPQSAQSSHAMQCYSASEKQARMRSPLHNDSCRARATREWGSDTAQAAKESTAELGGSAAEAMRERAERVEQAAREARERKE